MLSPNYLTLDMNKYAIFIKKKLKTLRAPKRSLLNLIEMKSTNNAIIVIWGLNITLANHIIELFMADIQEISRNQNPTPSLATG